MVGGGFRAGFGGCFGVLAAVILVGFALLMYATLSGNQHDEATGPRREVIPPPTSTLGSWTLNSAGGGSFHARGEGGGAVTLTVSCSRRGGAVFGVWFEGVPPGASDSVVLTTFVIDGEPRSVRMEGVGLGSPTFVATFPDDNAGYQAEQSLGRALLGANTVEWRSPRAGIAPQRWELTPDAIAEEATRRCG